MPSIRLDTDGLATDWPPPRRALPRWVRWVLPAALLVLVGGLVYGFGGFEQRRYRPELREPGTTVTMDSFDITPQAAYLIPRTNQLTPRVEVRIIGICENRRDDTVLLNELSRAGVLVVDPRRLSERTTSDIWVGTWTGVGSLSLPPGQGPVPCHIKAELPDSFEPTGTILLQLSNVSYADRTLLQIGVETWGGSTQDYVYYIPLSRR